MIIGVKDHNITSMMKAKSNLPCGYRYSVIRRSVLWQKLASNKTAYDTSCICRSHKRCKAFVM
jgi:hypothetical protein